MAKWDEVMKLQRKMNRNLVKLEQVVQIETEIRQTIKSSSKDSPYRDDLYNLRADLTRIMHIDKPAKAMKELKNFQEDFGYIAGQVTTWPPAKQRIELTAQSMVNMLANSEFRHRITSAVENDFVSSEANFYNRTVREIINSGLVPKGQERDFVEAVNKYIEKANESSDEPIKKLSTYWFRKYYK